MIIENIDLELVDEKLGDSLTEAINYLSDTMDKKDCPEWAKDQINEHIRALIFIRSDFSYILQDMRVEELKKCI